MRSLFNKPTHTSGVPDRRRLVMAVAIGSVFFALSLATSAARATTDICYDATFIGSVTHRSSVKVIKGEVSEEVLQEEEQQWLQIGKIVPWGESIAELEARKGESNLFLEIDK